MKLIVLFLLIIPTLIYSQNKIDVRDYHIQLTVNDTNNVIHVEEDVMIQFTEDCSDFSLDLISQNEDGTGMTVTSIKENDTQVEFSQIYDQLIIRTKNGRAHEFMIYKIIFSGIPQDGLVIGENKYGSRTFFGDNWPNRARNWFACVDHPSDKATVNYTVFAPAHYKVIANGLLEGEYETAPGQKMTTYRSEILLPTKVMVVGIAEFVTQELGNKYKFPHSIWVYPEDEKNGFNDMQIATAPLDYFISHIAPYPFEKLANVQSTTRFGGMENAGCIFYDEDAVKGDNSMEALIAHEIAHQWFGNSASESDWHHVWLSEGFATYFTDLYWEHAHGTAAFNERLIKERKRVIDFSKKYKHPVIDTTYADLMDLLNPNSYQKGAWVLHMLRRKVGDTIFWKSIRRYYDSYEYSNAGSIDFFAIVAEEAGMDLNSFFQQWLRTSGQPMITANFKSKKNKSTINIIQLQNGIGFEFPLEVLLNYDDGTSELKTINLSEKQFELNIENRVTSIELDPNVNLLFEEVK